MPPKPPLPLTVKLEAHYTGPNGQKATNIMYALTATQLTTLAQLNTMAQNFAVALEGSGGAVPFMAVSWTLTTTNAIDNSGLSELTGSYAVPPANGGGGTSGNALPGNCASVLSWTIPAHYRGGHPRTYCPGVPESAITAPGSNQLTTSWRAQLQAFGAFFLSSFNAALVSSIAETIGTISYHRNHVATVPPVFYPYTGGYIHGRLDSQRRRLGKESAFG